MIDIHSHILYDIDDGSESLDMSLQMLRMSVDSGVTDIIATPHVNRQGHIPAWQPLCHVGTDRPVPAGYRRKDDL